MRTDYEIEVCETCFMVYHYGHVYERPIDNTTSVEPLGLVPAGYDIDDVHFGESGAHFSWASCDGCGSTLGGNRFTFAVGTPRV